MAMELHLGFVTLSLIPQGRPALASCWGLWQEGQSSLELEDSGHPSSSD